MLDILCRPDLRRNRLVQVLIDYALVVALVALIAALLVPGFLESSIAVFAAK